MLRTICVILLLLNTFSVRTDAISAKSHIVIDAKSGRIISQRNADSVLPMASTTKIMTGLLACESNKLTEIVQISSFAAITEGSSLWLKPGEKQTLLDLTYGLMLKSGNDAAVAIAEHLAGNIDAFAVIMNKKARDIGAINTHFVNPHGLDSEKHYTTARDLALITREALKNRTFSKIVSTKEYIIPFVGEKWNRKITNHNKLLWRLEGCNGVKTGFTKRCGRCLVSSAKRGNEHLICVTLDAPDDWNDHTELLEQGFEKYESISLAQKNHKVCNYRFNENKRKTVDFFDTFSILSKKFLQNANRAVIL